MKQYIEDNFDFKLTHIDCDTFLYEDLSSWVNDVKPEVYDLMIIPSGFSDTINVKINPDKINILINEGSNVKLKDGVYCFKVNNHGISYSKYIGVACILECKLNQLIAKAELRNYKDFEEISEIKFLLTSFHINVNLNKIEKAISFYNLAEEKLSCVKCNC